MIFKNKPTWGTDLDKIHKRSCQLRVSSSNRFFIEGMLGNDKARTAQLNFGLAALNFTYARVFLHVKLLTIQEPVRNTDTRISIVAPANAKFCEKMVMYKQDRVFVVAADEEDVVLITANDLRNFIDVKDKKTQKDKPKKESKKLGTSDSSKKKSGPKQLFNGVKKPVVLFMKKGAKAIYLNDSGCT